MDNNIITNLKNSIINKATSLVSSHNNNSTAHADMRILLNAKIDKSSTEGLVKNDGSIDTNTYLTSQDLTNYEITTNKGSASVDKMGKFYIETTNNKTNVYYVKEDYNSRGHIYFVTSEYTHYEEIHGENLDTTKYYYYLQDDNGTWKIKGQLVHNGSGVWNMTNDSQLISSFHYATILISDNDLEISNYNSTYVKDLDLDPSTYTILEDTFLPYNDFYFGACGYIWHKLDDDILDELDISGKEDNANKTTTLSSSSTNTQYPSAKCVYDYIDEVIGEAIDYINR